MLKFSDLVIVLAMWRKQRQQADQRLCFRTCKRFVCFSHDVVCISKVDVLYRYLLKVFFMLFNIAKHQTL